MHIHLSLDLGPSTNSMLGFGRTVSHRRKGRTRGAGEGVPTDYVKVCSHGSAAGRGDQAESVPGGARWQGGESRRAVAAWW
jgi:hypothetical protein